MLGYFFIGVGVLLFAGVTYGASQDIRRAWDDYQWRRDEKRAAATLAELAGWITPEEERMLERFRSGAAWAEAMLLQLQEIRDLPQTTYKREWMS